MIEEITIFWKSFQDARSGRLSYSWTAHIKIKGEIVSHEITGECFRSKEEVKAFFKEFRAFPENKIEFVQENLQYY